MLNAPSTIRIAEDVAAVPQAPVRLPVARRGHEGPGRPDVGHIHGKAAILCCPNKSGQRLHVLKPRARNL